MSGGSFGYLCFKDDPLADENMESMIDVLRAYGPRGIAAADRLADLKAIRDSVVRQARLFEKVMQAVEWHVSCDWSREQVIEVLCKWADGK